MGSWVSGMMDGWMDMWIDNMDILSIAISQVVATLSQVIPVPEGWYVSLDINCKMHLNFHYVNK